MSLHFYLYTRNSKLKSAITMTRQLSSDIQTEIAVIISVFYITEYMESALVYWHVEIGIRALGYRELATAGTSANGEVELTATIDGQVKTITEASLRRHLKLEDNGGVTTLPNS
ncbi:hypothetical protein Tco_0223807 [Tanacetum coccineum]